MMAYTTVAGREAGAAPAGCEGAGSGGRLTRLCRVRGPQVPPKVEV
jgi:hypothetical protein